MTLCPFHGNNKPVHCLNLLLLELPSSSSHLSLQDPIFHFPSLLSAVTITPIIPWLNCPSHTWCCREPHCFVLSSLRGPPCEARSPYPIPTPESVLPSAGLFLCGFLPAKRVCSQSISYRPGSELFPVALKTLPPPPPPGDMPQQAAEGRGQEGRDSETGCLTMWAWANFLAALSHYFLTCKMRLIAVAAS